MASNPALSPQPFTITSPRKGMETLRVYRMYDPRRSLPLRSHRPARGWKQIEIERVYSNNHLYDHIAPQGDGNFLVAKLPLTTVDFTITSPRKGMETQSYARN